MRKTITLLTLAVLTIIVCSATAENRKRSDERAQLRKSASVKVAENTVQKVAPATEQPITIVQDSAGSIEVAPPNVDVTTRVSSPAAGEQIKWQVIASGGGRGSSANFVLTGTAGQTAVGLGASTNYKMSQGFWQNFSSSCCVKEGDANHNGSVNVIDITYLVSYLFKSGPAAPCKDEADVNDSGSVNVIDLTILVGYLFKGGSVGVCP